MLANYAINFPPVHAISYKYYCKLENENGEREGKKNLKLKQIQKIAGVLR